MWRETGIEIGKSIKKGLAKKWKNGKIVENSLPNQEKLKNSRKFSKIFKNFSTVRGFAPSLPEHPILEIFFLIYIDNIHFVENITEFEEKN